MPQARKHRLRLTLRGTRTIRAQRRTAYGNHNRAAAYGTGVLRWPRLVPKVPALSGRFASPGCLGTRLFEIYGKYFMKNAAIHRDRTRTGGIPAWDRFTGSGWPP